MLPPRILAQNPLGCVCFSFSRISYPASRNVRAIPQRMPRLFLREGGSYLDLGCADGSLVELFVNDGVKSQGVEISKEAVAVANAKGLDVVQSRVEKLPDRINKASVVTAFDVLEHLSILKPALSEIHRVLEDNGMFVFSTLAVEKVDKTDYWFNNSLEHYAYFDKSSLANILNETFGKGNHRF